MKKLKKIVLRLPIYPIYSDFFGLFEKFEVIHIHRQVDDQIFQTTKVRFKDPMMHPKMLEGDRYRMQFIEILEEHRTNKEYIFFSAHKMIEETIKLFENLKYFIIEPPIILDNDRLLTSVITENKNINEIFEIIDGLFEKSGVEILSISNMHVNYDHLFLKLTDRQKDIIYYAVQHGYFEIPRKINTKEMAKHFNITRSAFYEHLRKIEKTLYHSVFK